MPIKKKDNTCTVESSWERKRTSEYEFVGREPLEQVIIKQIYVTPEYLNWVVTNTSSMEAS